MKLRDYLESVRASRFRYGAHDCALFAARWVELVTGADLTLGIRYKSQKAGLAALKEKGFDGPLSVARQHLKPVPVAMARRGDVASVDGALGIVDGERIAVLRPDGLGWVDLVDATEAFEVRPCQQ